MSKTTLRGNGKPPLARSPIGLRSRRVLQPTANNASPIPPGSLTKSHMPKRSCNTEELELAPEYNTISYELRALAKMVREELGTTKGKMDVEFEYSANRGPLFERGRFYEEYSARRNERLKRKKGEMEGLKKKPMSTLRVRTEPAKKSESARKMAMASTPMAVQREATTSRYSLRSSTRKENKKPSLPLNLENSVGYITERKVGARRVRKT